MSITTVKKKGSAFKFDWKIFYYPIILIFPRFYLELNFMKIAICLIHFFMCIMGIFQLLAGSKYNPAITLLLVVGYGCSGFSLLSIGGKIFKWIAIVTNSIFVVFSLVGIVHFAIISPLSGGIFDTVALVGCIIFVVVGGVTVKLLLKVHSNSPREV